MHDRGRATGSLAGVAQYKPPLSGPAVLEGRDWGCSRGLLWLSSQAGPKLSCGRTWK